MEHGKLIVLEGIDGSGKSANYRKLCEQLQSDGVDYKNIVFPRYTKDSSALINMYLKGEFGSKPDDVNAYTASTFFAVDRFASFKDDWGNDYNSGKLILADRYTTSNAVHQGSKLPDNELEDFFSWLYDFEYNKMNLPKPDLVIYLDVEIELSLSRMKQRQIKTNTTADIHEMDVGYLERCLNTASKACDYLGWTRIDCRYPDGTEKSLDDKFKEIYKIVTDTLK